MRTDRGVMPPPRNSRDGGRHTRSRETGAGQTPSWPQKPLTRPAPGIWTSVLPHGGTSHLHPGCPVCPLCYGAAGN